MKKTALIVILIVLTICGVGAISFAAWSSGGTTAVVSATGSTGSILVANHLEVATADGTKREDGVIDMNKLLPVDSLSDDGLKYWTFDIVAERLIGENVKVSVSGEVKNGKTAVDAELFWVFDGKTDDEGTLITADGCDIFVDSSDVVQKRIRVFMRAYSTNAMNANINLKFDVMGYTFKDLGSSDIEEYDYLKARKAALIAENKPYNYSTCSKEIEKTVDLSAVAVGDFAGVINTDGGKRSVVDPSKYTYDAGVRKLDFFGMDHGDHRYVVKFEQKIDDSLIHDVDISFGRRLVTRFIGGMSALSSISDLSENKIGADDTLDGYYMLTADIRANGSSAFMAVPNWSGANDAGFIGTFDGCGHAIYDLDIDPNGMFNCVGSNGVIENFALINATGAKDGATNANFVIATEFRGTVDNVFITSSTKRSVASMSNGARISNSIILLSAHDTYFVNQVHADAVNCVIENIVAYADKTTNFVNPNAKLTITDVTVKKTIGEVREAMKSFDCKADETGESYWKLYNGYPIFKTCEELAKTPVTLLGKSNITLPSGSSAVMYSTGIVTGTAYLELVSGDAGITTDGRRIFVQNDGSATFRAAGLYGTQSAEKTIDFKLAPSMRFPLFDYELPIPSANSDVSTSQEIAVRFALPSGVSSIDRITFNGIYYDASDGYTVNDGIATLKKAIMPDRLYGDSFVTIDSGDTSFCYPCSYVTKIINSYTDFASLRTEGDTLDGYFVLGSDFDCNNATAMTELLGVWSSNPDLGFVGILDGRGHSITNLKLTANGIFWCLGNCEVRNIAFVNVSVSAADGSNRNSVFGSADCQGGTFKNVFVSTGADLMFGNAYNVVTLENVMFVSSKAEAKIFYEGNDSLTLKNIAAVCADFYYYYGGTPMIDGAIKYETTEAMLTAQSEDNKLSEWTDSLISYVDGKIMFNGKQVL